MNQLVVEEVVIMNLLEVVVDMIHQVVVDGTPLIVGDTTQAAVAMILLVGVVHWVGRIPLGEDMIHDMKQTVGMIQEEVV